MTKFLAWDYYLEFFSKNMPFVGALWRAGQRGKSQTYFMKFKLPIHTRFSYFHWIVTSVDVLFPTDISRNLKKKIILSYSSSSRRACFNADFPILRA